MSHEEYLKGVIRNAGFRVTEPRILVLAFLQKAKRPVDIKEIVSGLKKSAVDQVTIYRTVETFKKAGIVSLIDLQQGRAYYELKDIEHDHHHIVCTRCERVEDFVGCDYSTLIESALHQTKSFVKVTDHSFELFGLCSSCAK